MRREKACGANDTRDHAVRVGLVAGAGDTGQLVEWVAAASAETLCCRRGNQGVDSHHADDGYPRRPSTNGCRARAITSEVWGCPPREVHDHNGKNGADPFAAIAALRIDGDMYRPASFRPYLPPQFTRHGVAVDGYAQCLSCCTAKRLRERLAGLRLCVYRIAIERVRLGDDGAEVLRHEFSSQKSPPKRARGIEAQKCRW